jgi:hypothetical protein
MALIARVGIEGCRLYRQSFAGDYMVSAASQSCPVGTLGGVSEVSWSVQRAMNQAPHGAFIIAEIE